MSPDRRVPDMGRRGGGDKGKRKIKGKIGRKGEGEGRGRELDQGKAIKRY